MYETNYKIMDKGEAKYVFHIQIHTRMTHWKMNCTIFKHKRKFTYSLNLVTCFGSVRSRETREEGGREKKMNNNNNNDVIWQNSICKVPIYLCTLYSDQRHNIVTSLHQSLMVRSPLPVSASNFFSHTSWTILQNMHTRRHYWLTDFHTSFFSPNSGWFH